MCEGRVGRVCLGRMSCARRRPGDDIQYIDRKSLTETEDFVLALSDRALVSDGHGRALEMEALFLPLLFV